MKSTARITLLGMAGLCIAGLSACRADGQRAQSSTNTYTDHCEVTQNQFGRPVLMRGEIRFSLEKEGTNVRIRTSEYKITNTPGRNKANIDVGVSTWSNPQDDNSRTVSKLGFSADAMIQDGNWHSLSLTTISSVGYDVKRARSAVRFIFDMSNGDQQCWAENQGVTF